MTDVSCTRGKKRRLAAKVEAAEPRSQSSKVMQTSTVLILEVPADTDIGLPVWDALRSRQVDVTWSCNPYSISVLLTPATSKEQSNAASCKSERASSAAETSELSCSILQPQIPSVVQNLGASQKTSSILFPFSQNTQPLLCATCHIQKTPPNPNSVTSLIISLPLAILQPQPIHQPGKNTNKEVPSITCSPSITCTKLQVTTPLSFHTRSSSSVNICDNFLLGMCNSGAKCRMHHTPYPFHWQLWSITDHQWVDLPLGAQILLERIFCDPDKKFVYIKDGEIRYTLDFDSMELDDLSKYDAVRRLTNSGSAARNPYFPSRWKIYWWNGIKFEEYKTELSTMLLKKMDDKETTCSFHINAKEYRVDFTAMTQTNVSTNFQREISYRPVYHSPQSMEHYLKTGIQPGSGSAQPGGDYPGTNFSVDPLEEFSSWYPPVWCQVSELAFSLVDVPFGTRAYRSIQNVFHKNLPETKMDIICIQQVQNLLHWDKYQRQKAHMLKRHSRIQEPLERHLFHGTTKSAAESICCNNFDPRVSGVNGNSHGFGSYFATKACTSNNYADMDGSDRVRHMFLAKVLVGRVSLGKHHYRRPPPLSSKNQPHILYDTCVDNREHPSMFVVFDSCQCYPYYLIKYRELPLEVNIQE